MQAQRKFGRRCAQVLLLVGVIVAGDLLARSWISSRSVNFSLHHGGSGANGIVDLPAGSWGHSSPRLTELADGEVVQLQSPEGGRTGSRHPADLPRADQFFPHDVQYFPTAFQAGAQRTVTDHLEAATADSQRVDSQRVVSPTPSAATADSTEGWVQIHQEPAAAEAVVSIQATNTEGPVIGPPMPVPPLPVPPMPAPPTPEPAGLRLEPAAVSAQEDGEGRARVPAVVPDPLEPPHNAAPIHDNRRLEAVRSIVRQELPNASPEEVEIWVRELGALPGGAIRDLLSMRRKLAYEDSLQIPPLAANLPENLSDEVDVEIDVEELPPSASELTPRDPARFLPGTPYAAGPRGGVWSEPSMGAAEMVGDGAVFAALRQQALQNLLNIETAGYKAIRPRTMPLATRESMADPAPAILFEVDLSPGKLEHTGRSLDLAVDGPGFFAVKSPEGMFYTRCGQFVLNQQRQLVLAGQHQDYVLQLDAKDQPVAAAIGECVPGALQITQNGDVIGQTDDQGTSRRLGRIRLVNFDNPCFLMPVGVCFEATTESGAARWSADAQSADARIRLGRIVQGALERSNVDVDREQTRVARWARLHSVLQPQQVLPYSAPPAVFLDPPPGGPVAY